MKNLNSLATAGDPGDTIKQVRAVATELSTSIATLTPFMEEGPCKVAFTAAGEKITASMATLPTDGVGITAQSNVVITNILGLLSGAQETIKNLATRTQELFTSKQTALAGLPDAISAGVKAAIDSQVAAGTLFTKSDHETALATATTSAKTAAQTELTTNLNRVTTRQNALASAGLIAPSDILLADDAAFIAWETQTKARKTELAPYKLGTDRLNALMSATPAAYADSLALLKEVGTARQAPPNPLEGRRAPAQAVTGALKHV